MTIEFWWRQIFEILIFHKPSLGSLDGPQKIWARSVQPFWRLLDTNKQTDRQTDRQAKFIYRCNYIIICKQLFKILTLISLCVMVPSMSVNTILSFSSYKNTLKGITTPSCGATNFPEIFRKSDLPFLTDQWIFLEICKRWDMQ